MSGCCARPTWFPRCSRKKPEGKSHALVDKLGEKGWVDQELAPLCVVSRRRFGRHCLCQRSASFLQRRNLVAYINQHVAILLQLRLVADRLAVSRNDDGVLCRRGQVGIRCSNRAIDAAAC